MISDIILIIALIPLTIIVSFLNGITSFYNNIVPDSIYNAITTVIGYLGYFNGWFPIDTLLQVLYTLTIFFIAFYSIKIALWVWSLIPWLGKKYDLPTAQRNNKIK